MSTKSLWGNLDEFDLVRTPVGILKEQAHILTESTNGQLMGVVKSKEGKDRDKFVHGLSVRVPALNNYEFLILLVEHSIELYPNTVISNLHQKDIRCADETEFLQSIESILSSAEMKRILSRLLSQIN